MNDVNDPRTTLDGSGTQTAALAFGGVEIPPGAGRVTGATELWNGTNWISENIMSSARDQLSGAGTTTSSLAFGGNPAGTATEEWVGSGETTETID